MANETQEPTGDVYVAYDAVERCFRAFAQCAKLVAEAVQARQGEPRSRLGDETKESFAKLSESTKAARPKLSAIRRDIHRARVQSGLVQWMSTTQVSWAEAIVAQAELVLEDDWSLEAILEPESRMPVGRLTASLRRSTQVPGKLALEAASVAKVQEERGPDLSRMTETERKVYAAVLLHGPIDEKGINKLVYGHPTKGDSRRYAGTMYRFGLLDKVNEGYIVTR
jgi:hypothetical protein